jgi:hypothetical protein
MSENQIQSPKDIWYTPTTTHPIVEVGRHSMDFVVGLPYTSQKHDSIWLIIDRLTKIAHFQSSLQMAPFEALYGRRC